MGKMKDYIDRPFYDVDYCKYADWGYRRRTRIWTNLKGLSPKICKKDCNSMEGNKHKINIGYHCFVKVDGEVIQLGSKELRDKYINHEKVKKKKSDVNLDQRYKIPPKLIEELFNCMGKEG